MVAIALACSGVSCAFPLFVGYIDYGSVLFVSLPLSIFWFALTVLAIRKYHKQA